MIWHYQYLNKPVACTRAMKEAFYSESVGIPFIVAILYKLVQDEAIISRKESFTVRDVHRVAQTKLGLTAQMRQDMLNGVDVELNQFEAYWKPVTMGNQPNQILQQDLFKPPQDLQSRLEAKLIRDLNIKVAEARRLARQALAAFPQEQDLEVLYGYARELHANMEQS